MQFYYSKETVGDELYRQERLLREAKFLKEAGENSWGRDAEEEKEYRWSLRVIQAAKRAISLLNKMLVASSRVVRFRRLPPRSSRGRHSMVRSAAKSDDGGGGDGESDQGEPPKSPCRIIFPAPIQAQRSLLLKTQSINSFPLRFNRPGQWCFVWGWAS